MAENHDDPRVVIDDGEVDADTDIAWLAYRTPGGWGQRERIISLKADTVAALELAGVQTVRDLNAFTEGRLKEVEGVGERTLQILKRGAAAAGVRLADDESMPSVTLRLWGDPAERIVRFAQEIGATPSELMAAVLDNGRVEDLARWASLHTAEVLRDRARELQSRAKALDAVAGAVPGE